MSARILSLHIYPVKSCAGIDLAESPIDRAGLAYDRRWMVVDADGVFMTQRQWPAMALIRTALAQNALRLSAPGMPDLDVALDGSGLESGARTVGVWSDTISARSESAAAAQWLTEFLKTPCRLLKVDIAARRNAKPDWVSRWVDAHPDLADAFVGEHCFGFADGFPLLVANQASLDDLNARLQAKGAAPVPMDRFRPNIVIQGEWEPFEEDHTAMITAADVRMAFVKPCTRCSIPDIDQQTARQYDEPGRTLAGYRNLDIGVVFGQNAILDAPAGARLKVGDAVDIELDF
ncbi:MOSC domain-containing protein [Achromobacter arsenitoxydans]|uniref:MOSC domain-containing protein 1 n=1 Tax=Achromobacter arsenitoxydans SY8 TaxID=477184 RepID=H0FA56_9BURK|nr:MOSC N-terminal beta barrel domain-containing protein [Achromobacter arsenitoxydans]EHK64863.1 MOSC domain-containing protein 1 [Achromobacter arsenitoxydans SY8]